MTGFARPLLPHERLELGAFPGEKSPFVFPGLAVVTFDGELDTDEPKAGGKDDAEIKLKGRKTRDVNVKLTWLTEFDKEALDYIEALHVGPNNGKPREIMHPDARAYKVVAVVFKKFGKIERTPRTASIDISGKSSAKPKNTLSGGAKGDGAAGTPKDAAQWQTGHPPTGKVPIGTNNNEVSGFDDPAQAPKAEPKK